MILLLNNKQTDLKRWSDLMRQWDIPFRPCRDEFTALQIIQTEKITGVISRLDLSMISGFELSRRIKRDNPGLPVALFSDGDPIETPPRGITREWDIGPIPPTEANLQKTAGIFLLASGELLAPDKPAPFLTGNPDFPEIIGRSDRLNEALILVDKVKDQEVTVLIQGESGTGKELFARAIHHRSGRADKPFVSVNCAAMPEPLLESELFGHEKGSFTGASSRVMGRFEQAHTGCLFLDEIGDMSPATQAKVLRVFEGHEFERVGGRDKINVDVRIIAATNRDLQQKVEEGMFREDLFYRVGAFPILLPPLRKRMEDLPLITAHILRQFNRSNPTPIRSVTVSALEKLLDYAWPGNIRHLENVLRRGAILAGEGVVDAPHIIPERRRRKPPVSDTHPSVPAGGADKDEEPTAEAIRSLAEVEEEAIRTALNRFDMNVSRSARALGITRPTLYKKADEYGIEINRGRE